MPAKLISDEYKYYDIVYSDTAECSIDTEYYLPDYCPDIQKILKCCVVPDIENSSVAGDRLSVSGSVSISVMYCDEKAASVRSCEFTKDFSCTVKLQNQTSDAAVDISAHCGYIVCRAVNARKLDVHIPLLLDCNVYSAVTEPFTKDVENSEKLLVSEPVSEALMFCRREININNDFELPESAPPIESVFRKNVSVSKFSYVAENNAVTVRGDLEFTVCYRSYADNSVLEKMSYSSAFTETIHCEGITADSECQWLVKLIPSGYSLQLREDSMGEYTRMSLYLKADVLIGVYRNRSLGFVKDAYTTDCIGKEKYGKLSVKSYEQDELNSEIVRSISLDNCERILDIWCSDFTVSAFAEPGKLNYRGSFLVNVIYSGRDKRLSSSVKQYDFTLPSEVTDANQRRSSVSGRAELTDFRLLSENEVEFKIKIGVKAFISVKKLFEQLTEEEYICDLPERSCGKLIVCYDSTQGLWELGKRHRIPLEAIRSANDICDDADCKYPLILFR